MDVRAIVFDLDDTLLDWQHAHGQGVAAAAGVLADHGHAPESTVATWDRVVQENIRSYHATGRWWTLADRIEALLAKMIVGPRDHLHDPLHEAFTAAVHRELRWLPGAEEVLVAAAQRGPVGLLTNGPGPVQRAKVDALGLADFVDVLHITGETGAWKPSHEAFHGMVEALGVAHGEALMVGDSLYFDIAPAQEVGMATAWLDPHVVEPVRAGRDLHVAGVHELLPHL